MVFSVLYASGVVSFDFLFYEDRLRGDEKRRTLFDSSVKDVPGHRVGVD